MGLSNFLIEGILNKNDFLDKYGGLGGLRADAEEYELFYKQFLDEFDRTIVSKLSEEELNNFVQLVEDAHRTEKDPLKKFFYTKNVRKVFNKFIEDCKNIETMHSRWNLFIDFFIDYKAEQIDDYIVNGTYYPQENTIVIKIDLPRVLYIFIKHDPYSDKYLNKWLEMIEHELVHAVQIIKNGDDVLLGAHFKKKPNKKESSNLRYMGTPIEIPAQAKSIAAMYYLDNNKNADKAIEALKKLKEPSTMSSAQRERWEYVSKQLNNTKNKKVRTLLKYAFLYLNIEKIEQEGLK